MVDAATPTTSSSLYQPWETNWNDTESTRRNTSYETTADDLSSENLKQFFMQKLCCDKTGFHKEYSPATGIRIAVVLGVLLMFVFIKTLCKSWCQRHQWSSNDKHYLQYCKAKHQAAAGTKSCSLNSSYHGGSFTRRFSVIRPDPATMEATARWIQSQPLNDKSHRNMCSLSCIDCHKTALCNLGPMQYSLTASSLGVSTVAGSASQQELGECHNMNVAARNFYDTSEVYLYQKENAVMNSPRKWQKKDTFQTKSFTDVTPQDLLFNGYCLEVCSFIDKRHTRRPVLKIKDESLFMTEKETPAHSNLCSDVPVICETNDKNEDPFASVSMNSMWNHSSLQRSIYNQDGTYDLSGSLNVQMYNETTSSTEQTQGFASQKLVQSMPYLKPQDANHMPHDTCTDRSRCIVSGMYPSLSISTGQINSITRHEYKFPFNLATSYPGKAVKQNPVSP